MKDIQPQELEAERFLNKNEIINGKLYTPAICGVYFLIKDKEVVYVGSSVDVKRRLGEHKSQKTKDFDSCKFIRCSDVMLRFLESYYIHTLEPVLNCLSKAPLSLDLTSKVLYEGKLEPIQDLLVGTLNNHMDA